MKKVYLHGVLGEKYGFEHILNISSASDCLQALEANFEGFYEDVIKAETEGNPFVFLTKSPDLIESENDLQNNCVSVDTCFMNQFSEEFHLISEIKGSAVIIPTIATAIAKITIGAIVKAIVVSLVVSLVMNALFKPPKPPQRKDPISTKSYLMAGGVTRQAQGIPVPLGYGTLKIGPSNIASKKISKVLQSAAHLESYSEMLLMDLLCEGAIEGFVDQNGALVTSDEIYKSIYLNETPIQNAQGSFNYVLNEGVEAPTFKLGSDLETKVLDSSVYSTKDYDVLLYGPPPYGKNKRHKDGKNNSHGMYNDSEAFAEGAKIVSHFVSNPDVGQIIVSFKTEVNKSTDQGEVQANSLGFAILIHRNNQDYNVLDEASGCIVRATPKGISKKSDNGNYFLVSGIATTAYQFDITINFDSSINREQLSNGVTFKFLKLSPELDPTVKGGSAGGIMQSKRIQVAHVVEVIKESLLYPNTAMVSMLIDSKNFSQVPDRSYHLKLKKVLIPQNYDPVSRTYSGAWNGLFKGQNSNSDVLYSIKDKDKYWTDNPAWVLFDLLHNPRYGVGKYGLEEQNIDKWQLYKIAKYCDELVRTNYPIETTSGFPMRFNTNNETQNELNINIFPGAYELTGEAGKYFLSDQAANSISNRYYLQQSGDLWHINDSLLYPFLNDFTFSQKFYEVALSPGSGIIFSAASRIVEAITKRSLKVETQLRRKSDGQIIATSIYQNPASISHVSSNSGEITRSRLSQLSGEATYSDLLTNGLVKAQSDFSTHISASETESLFDFSSEPINQSIGSYDNQNKAKQELDLLNHSSFIEDFGTGQSFRGKKIVFFIHKNSGGLSEKEVALRSSISYDGSEIVERTILHSDPDTHTLTVSGPPIGKLGEFVVGGCAVQKNHPIVEPRFSANIYLTDRAEALEIIQNLCSIFRGMAAYSAGKIYAIQDSDKKPVQIFNNANVQDPGFTYFGSHAVKRITASLVRFNNKEKNYKPDIVYEEDTNAVSKFGYLENETMGLGITSESQARRLAKWILYTSQLETETIKFTAGIEGSYLFPGSIFEVVDKARSGNHRSGRVLEISFNRQIQLDGENLIDDNDAEILLDKSAMREASLGKVELRIVTGRNSESSEIISNRATYYESEYDQDAEIDAITSPQYYTFEGSLSQKEGKSLIHSLLLKLESYVDIKNNKINCYNHRLEEGDRVVFRKNGKLPYGLNPDQVYTVKNPTKHTFELVKILNTDLGEQEIAVSIYTEGLDDLGNQGGLIYTCPYMPPGEENLHLKNALSEIPLGVGYSLTGQFSLSGSDVLSPDFINESLHIDLTKSKEYSSWKFSKLLGEIYVDEKQGGWVFSSSLNEWINVSHMLEGKEWFWCDSMGWIAVKKDGIHAYWYIYEHEKLIHFNTTTLYFYCFDADRAGFFASIAKKNQYLVASKKIVPNIHHLDFGFHFWFYGAFSNLGLGIHAFSNIADAHDHYGDFLSPTSRPQEISYWGGSDQILNSFEILDLVPTFFDQSDSGRYCVTVVLDSFHEGDVVGQNSISIVGFNSNNESLNERMNASWEFYYKGNNIFELLDSESAFELLEQEVRATDSSPLNFGSASFLKSPTSKNKRTSYSQLFRTSSVKEVSANQYEIIGTEYNPSKFNSVEKVGVLRRPTLPIPPQPDMSIPEGPSNLNLTAILL